MLHLFLRSVFFTAFFVIVATLNSEYALAGIIFHPNACEYSIEFSEKPNTEEYSLPDGQPIQMAFTTLKGNKGGLKVECMTLNDYDPTSVNKGTMLTMLKHNAEESGVTNIVYEYRENYLGKIGIYRGVIASAGNTFVSITILGSKSGLTIVGSAPYQEYHQLHYEKFIQSVKRYNASGKRKNVRLRPAKNRKQQTAE